MPYTGTVWLKQSSEVQALKKHLSKLNSCVQDLNPTEPPDRNKERVDVRKTQGVVGRCSGRV